MDIYFMVKACYQLLQHDYRSAIKTDNGQCDIIVHTIIFIKFEGSSPSLY